METAPISMGDLIILATLAISIIGVVMAVNKSKSSRDEERGRQLEFNKNIQSEVKDTERKLEQHIKQDQDTNDKISRIQQDISGIKADIKNLLR